MGSGAVEGGGAVEAEGAKKAHATARALPAGTARDDQLVKGAQGELKPITADKKARRGVQAEIEASMKQIYKCSNVVYGAACHGAR